jgi:hypothetical protein
MPELGSYGSVRGARGNSRPYRESSGRGVKPSHRAYAAKATEMRRRMLDEVRRLDGLQGSAIGRLLP